MPALEALIDRNTGVPDALERAARRYLGVVKAALLDEHYLDNEMRIEYLATLRPGAAPDLATLRDPARHLPVRYERLRQARIAGRSTDEGRNPALFPYTDMGTTQLDRLEAALRDLRDAGVPGDLAEIGVGRGGGAIFLRAVLEAYEIPDTRVWVIDRYLASVPEGGETPPDDTFGAMARYRADLNQVTDGFARFDLCDDRVRFVQGAPHEVLRTVPIERLALARLGAGVGAGLKPALQHVHALMSPGGVVIVDGISAPRVEAAVVEVREALGVTTPLERIDWNSVMWRVPEAPAASGRAAPAAPAPDAAAPVESAGAVDLSIVVVFYNMRREAARTLLSLTRSYQRGIEDLDYEVIVVENGSAPENRLGEEYVQTFGPQFRYLDLGAEAKPSPTGALNRGAALARGEHVAFMIDGAHVLTPGVLRLGMTALRTYAPAVVATQQWYLGPGQQGDSLHAGYDQAAEDRLFTRIKWPVDGYRLFEIGHFIGDRDWFDGIVESNCVFVPRAVLERVGAFDDSFSVPGGGYANLDLYERIGSLPGVTVASLLGEGTFHQVHGGTTTNIADAADRRDLVASYREGFKELRGRDLVGITKPVYYLGAMATKAARRTRSRRETDLSFDPLRDPVDTDDTTRPPTQVPDELKLAAIEAVWDSRAWRDAKWLGHTVGRLPMDLFTYQELLADVRPDVVVVAGDDVALGGRALFFASICDQLDHGRVVAVGTLDPATRPTHARIDHVVGHPDDAGTFEQVRALVGAEPRAVVFLGLGALDRVLHAFEQYAPLVPVGSYVVIENTVVNGRPVASGFGPGPHEAVVSILGRRREFLADPKYERYTLTFNRSGFLRRMR